MVQVRQQSHISDSGDIDLDRWLAQLPEDFDEADLGRVRDACTISHSAKNSPGQDFSDWSQESDCFAAGLDIGQILADLHVGTDCLIAGILYRAVREERLPLEQVESHFGEEVGNLIRGVLRMGAISEFQHQSESPVLGQAHGQKDNIRKMLISLVDDVRVALIKLAERACAIRAVKNDEQRRRGVAQEVFDVYAPLAHRLGIGHLKWELEDLSFRYIYTEAYRKIARLLDGKRAIPAGEYRIGVIV